MHAIEHRAFGLFQPAVEIDSWYGFVGLFCHHMLFVALIVACHGIKRVAVCLTFAAGFGSLHSLCRMVVNGCNLEST